MPFHARLPSPTSCSITTCLWNYLGQVGRPDWLDAGHHTAPPRTPSPHRRPAPTTHTPSCLPPFTHPERPPPPHPTPPPLPVPPPHAPHSDPRLPTPTPARATRQHSPDTAHLPHVIPHHYGLCISPRCKTDMPAAPGRQPPGTEPPTRPHCRTTARAPLCLPCWRTPSGSSARGRPAAYSTAARPTQPYLLFWATFRRSCLPHYHTFHLLIQLPRSLRSRQQQRYRAPRRNAACRQPYRGNISMRDHPIAPPPLHLARGLLYPLPCALPSLPISISLLSCSHKPELARAMESRHTVTMPRMTLFAALSRHRVS